MDHARLDCVVVGGGPAGLTAALYLARFRLNVRLYDEGHSRAALIPLTRNLAGFPEGIAGTDLLARMRYHAVRYGADLKPGRVEGLTRQADSFQLMVGGEAVEAHTVLLATGVTNRRPPMDEAFHTEALATGRVRYCPVCDGYEVIDKAVAVIGTGEHAVRETAFLRSYTARLTLIAPVGPHALADDDRARLAQMGVAVRDGPSAGFRLEDDGIVVETPDGSLMFDAVYPAMGSHIHSALALAAGATMDDQGCIRVDAHQRTSIAGLYAAGDVVAGLDQIVHATGEAAVAATTIRNDLASD